VVDAEAAEELGVGEEASPAPADGGCARKGGWLRREADEDLPEEIVVFKRGGRRRRRGAAASHSGALLARVHLAVKERAAAAGHSGALLTRSTGFEDGGAGCAGG